MNRNDQVLELARLCRGSHAASLWVVAYLAQGIGPTELQEAVDGAREVYEAWIPRTQDHLTAYRERWGRFPG